MKTSYPTFSLKPIFLAKVTRVLVDSCSKPYFLLPTFSNRNRSIVSLRPLSGRVVFSQRINSCLLLAAAIAISACYVHLALQISTASISYERSSFANPFKGAIVPLLHKTSARSLCVSNRPWMTGWYVVILENVSHTLCSPLVCIPWPSAQWPMSSDLIFFFQLVVEV